MQDSESEESAQPLIELQLLLNHVYFPLEDKDLKAHIQKFAQVLQHTAHQIIGSINIDIPPVPATPDEVLDKRQELDAALENWSKVIENMLEKEATKKVEVKNSALAEINFWRNKSATLSAFHQKFNLPQVRDILEMMEQSKDNDENPAYNEFMKQMAKLNKVHAEAKDNEKFLLTLERQFTNLQKEDLDLIEETLASMMNGLRLVWTISRHFKDDPMLNLMQCIANEIADHVEKQIQIKEIFEIPPLDAMNLIDKGMRVLEKWKSTYNETRKEIDKGENRWPYDQKRLFSRTDHMAKVLANIREVAKTNSQFDTFLGDELKRVTKDADGINEIRLMVTNACKPLIEVQNVYLVKNKEIWGEKYRQWEAQVKEIEDRTIDMIDRAFKDLRSAESAFNLIQNFKNLDTREAIDVQLKKKYSDILRRYGQEVDQMDALFQEYKKRPKITKGKPPVAGAIAWSESLFRRVQRPILKFKNHATLLESDDGKIICKKFFELGHEIKRVHQVNETKAWGDKTQTAIESLQKYILKEDDDKYVVQFDPNLQMMIREAKYMDKSVLSNAVLHVALQEKKYRKHIDQLNSMLQEYDQTVLSLTPVEKKLLKAHIALLRMSLKPGTESYNWNSLGIKSFIDSCRKAISTFAETKSKVHKEAAMIEERVQAIEDANLIKKFDWQKQDIMDITEFSQFFDKHREECVKELRQKYEEISSNLENIEDITVDSKTRYAESMLEYYRYWERRVFNAITKMIIRALLSLKTLFTKKENRPPLFTVKAVNPPDVTYQPPQQDIEKHLQNLTTNILESAKKFPRWKDGHCNFVRKIEATDGEETYLHTFYTDVSKIQNIKSLQVAISNQCDRLSATMTKNVKKIQKEINSAKLWDEKLMNRAEKSGDQNFPLLTLETSMSRYYKIVKDTEDKKNEKRVIFMIIDNTAVNQEIKKQAGEWLKTISKIVYELGNKQYKTIDDDMNKFKKDLQEQPDGIYKLKFVLNVISNINNAHMLMEFRINEVQEKFRTLQMYEYEGVDRMTYNNVAGLNERWTQLRAEANFRDFSMLKVKEHFSTVTTNDVAQFYSGVKIAYEQYMTDGPGAEGTSLKDGDILLLNYKEKIAELNKKREELVHAQQLFNLPITAYPELVEIEDQNRKLTVIYDLYRDQQASINEWSGMTWVNIDINSIEKGSDEFYKRLNRMNSEYHVLTAYHKLKEFVAGFKESVPLIKMMKSDAIKDRHWKKLMKETGLNIDIDLKTITLQQIFDLQLQNHQEKVEEIINEASQESKIEESLQNVEQFWKTCNFEIGDYKKGNEFKSYALKSADEITGRIENDLADLGQIGNSRFAGAFMGKVSGWEKQLNTVQDTIDIWFIVQTRWQYLESIFIGSDDIRLQLVEEAKKFDRINKKFIKIMENTSKNPNVMACCYQEASRAEEKLNELTDIYNDLESCQKRLTSYLNTKKGAFPRFYFISDDELLSILGSTDAMAVQPHMLKLYDNCKELKFGRGNMVTGMWSDEGEDFEFLQGVKTEGAVEDWMNRVDDAMIETLRHIMKHAVFNYAKEERIIWCQEQLGMVTLAGTAIWWTWYIEDVFRKVLGGNKHAMKDESAKETKQLQDVIGVIRDTDNSIIRKKINALIIMDVHARDIVDKFVRDSVLDARQFEWESQLRFAWNRDVDDIRVNQCTGEFPYCYEYQGLNGRLVITPLTDRCIMTLTTALTFHLGGAPAGPAGTGKTETVKDLAKSLAIRCVVNNCGEGLDAFAMGTIFSGLAQTGFWGCFDEFNRILPEVLSVVASQIRTVQYALNNGRATLDLLGKDIPIKTTVGIFVTMNPGYAGRTELPDNLKALFRPVVMCVPDMDMICEIMLMSEGFIQARVLAKKMTVLYDLAKGQLSKQHHYDFGLRALKSVLVMAGSLKRGSPDLTEDIVLMRALRDMNKPKFIFEDVPLFEGLITDLFPGLTCDRVGYEVLKVEIENFMELQRYKHTDEDKYFKQVDKVMQLYEVMLTRHTTMIVGPTGGGKSVVIQTLQAALGAVENCKVVINTLNSKSITVDELYGVLEPATREWTDGLLSKVFRTMNQPLAEGKKEIRWILYDSDVDALWVENMNSVMDDNRLLTLTNGERIRLQKHCAMLYEVFDLQYASPATISRCGMVFVDAKDLGHKPYYERWARSKEDLGEGVPEVLNILYNRYVDKIIRRIIEGATDDEILAPLKQATPRTGLNLVTQLCTMIDVMLPTENTPQEPELLENLYIFCIIWSLGGALTEESRLPFEEYVKTLAERTLPPGSLYNYYYDRDTRVWPEWDTKVKARGFELPADRKFSSILVPTIDTERYSWLLGEIILLEKPVLFVGESGTAKSVTISNYLGSLDSESFLLLNINFSSRTTSYDAQLTLEDRMDKRTGKNFGPPIGKKMIVFIDDMNMPKVDTYGTQQPIAWFKFLIEKGYIYNRATLEDKHIKDTLYCAALQPPGGGRPFLDPRYMSLFTIFNVTFPTEDNLKQIYKSILEKTLIDFEESMAEAIPKITDATLQLHAQVLEKLPRTPIKFHYIFNLRDFSRVYEGLYQMTKDKFETVGQLVKLWRNEITRVYADRLLNPEDAAVVNEVLLPDVIRQHFPEQSEYALTDPLLYGDYRFTLPIEEDEHEDPRLYEDLESFDFVKDKFERLLGDYNEDDEKRKPMNLVLFNDALDHLTRIHRILRMPRGNALLIGVGGSGKQSLTRLAAFTAEHEMFQISLSKNYTETNFRDDLKELYLMLAERSVCFLLTDSHIKEEGFLELINNVLTIGMVPAMYEEGEKDQLTSYVEDDMKKAGIVTTKDNKWNFFINKARDNLHVVLAFSPAGDTLRIRCRNFPGLVNNNSIDWFFTWPEEALSSVATYFLAKENLPQEHKQKITDHIVGVHMSIATYSREFEEQLKRKNHVTPKNYLDYINTYVSIIKDKKKQIDSQVVRLEAGLIKLDEAADAVEVMSKELAIRKKGVDEKKEIVEGIIAGIASRTEIANEQQLMANEKQAELIVFNEKISKEEAAADIALQEAIPALEAAEAALSVLDSKAFTEVKALAQPPEAIRDVCHCVCILKPLGSDTPPDSEGWTSSKAMLTNTNLLKKLREYEKDKITASMHRKLNDYFKKSTFNYETIRGVNKATGNLFMWVEAMKLYYEVNKKIEPLRRELKSARAKLDAAKKELESIQIKLTALNEELADLNEKREVNETELNRLTEEADTMERRLTAASKLITGLGGEKVRWSADVGQLKEDKVALVGDVLLCSGFLSYTGPFNFGFRQRMLQEDWIPDVKEKEIPLSDDFAIDKLLTSDVEIAKWASEGLPGDELSIQNGILTESSSRWPLCIDPQEQAVVWIREKEQRNKLTRTSLNDPKYPKELEGAIRYGYSILFENVDEEIDPMIDPVLEKAYTVQAGQKFINFGGSAIEWDNDFKMFLTTKLANPQYSPEIMAKTMIINYTVTMQGLEDQLLNEIVSHDRADLEESRKKLVVEMSENQSTRKALEESLLYELNNVTGSILDNDELIATLEETKQKSIFITEAIETAKTTKLEIDKQRNNFQPAAMRGSILFFSMTGLSNISKMYEYSLSNYLRVFRQALKEARRDNMVITRVKNIIDKLTSSIYEYVCLGIFERHKLMFSFQMTVMIIDADDDLDKIEFDFFLKGNTALEAVQMKKPYSWFPDQGWKDLDKLIVLNKNFHSLRDDILNDEKSWKSWYDLEQPESNPIPGEYSESLTTLEKLLILKVFRPDRCYNGIADFIVEKHNKNELYVTSTPATYESIYARTNNKSPVVFILSPGADPLSDVQKLADKMGFVGNKFKFLALGQGMAGQAEDYLRTGSQRGHWVMLQNCHLLPRWLKTLEKELEQMTKPHQDFRLWLTTEPSDAFPLSILQQSLKVVTEPPDGLRQNMRASYSKLTEESLEDCPAQEFRSLVYVLAFFHAVIQERRKFGKIGWNIRYEFNESDFRISFKLLTMYLTKAYDNQDEVLPWGSLRYLIGEAMYGGRVTDDFDRRVLNCYLDEYMGDFLFDTNQPFFFSTSGGFDYVIPEHGPIENYLNTMSEIPRKNSPEVFGLHANAEIGYFTSSTKDIWVNCILMQTNEGGGEGGINREDYLNGLIDDLEQKIPEEYDEFNIRKQFGEQLKPTQVVLLQELERFNKLLRVQMQTLRDLRSALKGEIGMSQDLDDLSNSCFNGFLPDLWRRLTPQTEKPLGAWMDWFTRRHKQYTKWVESGELICIWLSGLHIPESYLTALVQTTCRAKKWALDKSHLYTIITKYQRAEDVPGRLEHGCYIQGLYIEGARWDFERQCLTYQEPKELVFEMPVMQVVPVELNKLKLRGTLKTPVYVTQARRNAAGLGLVFQADMPALEHSSHWILQGVALSLNIDY